jgi:Tfp pilus assembly protein PilZ
MTTPPTAEITSMGQSEIISPRFVRFMAYLLWSFPITYLLMLATFYNLPLPRILSILFSFYFFAHSALALFTGWALWKMRPYAWHFFLLNVALMLVENFVVAYRYSETHIVEIPLALFIATAGAMTFMLQRELRVPYFSPKINWWESDPRYKISVPVEMACADRFYRGEIMDISSSGCFIKTKDHLKVDEEISVKFGLFDHQFVCRGKVVWRTESGVTHPKGIGVRFFSLERAEQGRLRQTVKKLRSLSRKFKDLRAEEKASHIERKVEALFSQRKG